MDSSSSKQKKDGLLVEEVAEHQQQHQPVAITAPTAKAKKGKYTHSHIYGMYLQKHTLIERILSLKKLISN